MRNRFRTYLGANDAEAGYNLSWGAVFAGLVTFIALLINFSLIGNAIGFGMIQPSAQNPLDGVGTGVMVWSVISLALSFLGSGFVAGVTARRVGAVHGFLSWAISLVVTVVLLGQIVASVLGFAGNVIGQTASVAGDAVTSVASNAGDAVSEGVNALANNIDVNNQDIQNLNQDVQKVLRDTDIRELQPEYLSDQLNGATNDIANAAREVVVNPQNSEQVFNDLADTLTSRVDNISENVDQEAVSNAIASNTDLTQQEAEETTQNIIDGYNQAANEARNQIENANNAIQSTQQQLDNNIQQLRQDADDVSDGISQGSIWAFVGVLLGCVLSCLGGLLGTKSVTGNVDETNM
ncbi:type III secretion system translocon subunit SctE [Aerococcus mictus]|uniref:type III secretion system translocon subunit SctE n=1 Tax=Aerococcus mictus TaxID=2976810 RepID=UPI000DCF1F74|nr:type III secretion system translocon subunit SctE [Aerococcus mictus]